MPEQPLVSVIMNCFNGEKYLREALDSVLAQTYTNWELIFWDNQSKDKSAEIFKKYNDPRCKYFFTPKHTLLSEARNCAIEYSTGELLAFLDVDDWWAPEKLEKQIPLFDDPKVALVYGNYCIHDQYSKLNKKRFSKVLPSGNMFKYLLKSYVVGLVTIVLRRDVYEKLDKKFDSRFPMSGDFDVVMRLAFSNYFAAVQQPIASYRWHGNNDSKLYNEKHIDELELWYEEMSANVNFSTINELLNVKININFLKGKNSVEERDFSSALKYFFLLPFCYHKLKLFAIIILPNFIVRYFSILKN